VGVSRLSALPFSGYGLRPVVVASDLEALRGPLHGRRQLPLHLDSSARPFYDFAAPRDRAQGYHIARPLPPDALVAWLEARESAAAQPA